jgi:hypothetical protein
VPLLGLNEESISYTKEALPEALVEASAQCRHRISSVTPRATREPTPAMTQKGPRLVRQAVVWSLLRRDMVILEYICDLVICRTPPHRHDGHRKAAGASARTWLLHILTLCGARHNVPLSRFHCWVLVLFTSFRCSNRRTPGRDLRNFCGRYIPGRGAQIGTGVWLDFGWKTCPSLSALRGACSRLHLGWPSCVSVLPSQLVLTSHCQHHAVDRRKSILRTGREVI